MGSRDIELLKETTFALLREGCVFWACEGYEEEPIHMKTCHVCRTLRNVFEVHPEWKEELT